MLGKIMTGKIRHGNVMGVNKVQKNLVYIRGLNDRRGCLNL